MPFEITNLNQVNPEYSGYYFFDSNVWLPFLQGDGAESMPSRQRQYVEFLNGVIGLNNITDHKARKKAKNIPKIVVTNLLLSEVLNAYLQHIAMKLYFGGGDTYKQYDFKRDYRENPNSDYDSTLNLIQSDLDAYKHCLVFMDDYLNEFEVLNSVDRKSDYNDNCFLRLCKSYNIPLITDDKDFLLEGVTILTLHGELLKRGG